MSFPNTPILDDFTRADNATSLGANWTGPTYTGDQTPGISSDQAYNSTGSFADALMTSLGTISTPMEAYCTFAALASTPGIAIDYLMGGTAGARNGYRLATINNTAIRISRIDATVFTNIKQVTQTISAGDAIGVAVDVSGIHTIWYKAAAGTWTSLGTITDTTYTSGSLGIGIAVSGTSRLDDFGGGSTGSGSQDQQTHPFINILLGQ